MPYERYSGSKPTEEEAIQAFYNYSKSEEKRRNTNAVNEMKKWYAEEAEKQKMRNKNRTRRLTRKTRKTRRSRR